MAEPIEFSVVRDPRAELLAKLDQAPADHAEALLAGYEVIQQLHNAGILNAARDLLSASDRLVEDAVAAANRPGSVRAIRNLIILAQMAESIEPEKLKQLANAMPRVVDAVFVAHQADPPSILSCVKIALGKNIRRGLVAIDRALQAARDSVTEPVSPKD